MCAAKHDMEISRQQIIVGEKGSSYNQPVGSVDGKAMESHWIWSNPLGRHENQHLRITLKHHIWLSPSDLEEISR
jgi:hypothetical protein